MQLDVTCGLSGTGCDDGVVQNCGMCPDNMCTPRNCMQAGAQCGIIGDGCGSTVDCGPCPDGTSCGGAGANLCGRII